MAKNKSAEATTETVTDAPVASGKGKKIILTNVADGSTIPRAEYIKARFAAGVSRSAIVKELKELFGHEVAYQIVFAATKPVKAAPAATEEVAA